MVSISEAPAIYSFARLVKKLSQSSKTDPPLPKFQLWLRTLPTPLPPSFGAHLLHLLYPHVSPRRRYGMQETLLSQRISYAMGWSPASASARALATWNVGEDLRAGVLGKRGFLGDEVQKVLEWRAEMMPGEGWREVYTGKEAATLAEVNGLLDQLAAHSPWSQIAPPLRPILTPDQIISKLYNRSHLSPFALSLLTQIILRDIRPLLDPLHPSALNPITALKEHTSTECPQLDLIDAFRCWDREMPALWKVRGDLDEVCAEVERMGGGAGRRAMPRLHDTGRVGLEIDGTGRTLSERAPKLHVNVTIPKAEKGRSMESAMQMATRYRDRVMDRREELWAEVKYDGYRMQIHVEVMSRGPPKITIFSKSQRNSTLDRLPTHPIILASLGLPFAHLKSHPKLSERIATSDTADSPSPITSIILEAEMIPYNEGQREGSRGPGIEEFWNLTKIGGGVEGPRDLEDKQDEGRHVKTERHLCLSYFDLLHVNGESYMAKAYSERRSALESIVRIIPGFSMCASRRRISLSNNFDCCMKHLEDAFSVECFENREEGLMLKHSHSVYNDRRLRWVKLKRDYIPGIGDCVDLVVIGAGWDRDRGRDLKVGTGAFTTMYIAVWTNREGVAVNKERPHFEHLFCSSYGLTRSELNHMNNQIRHGEYANQPYRHIASGSRTSARETLAGLSFDFSLRKDSTPPISIFRQPLVVELMGAGFQQLSGSRFHELRWPRTMKIFPPKERGWLEAFDGDKYHQATLAALGHSRDSQHMLNWPSAVHGDGVRNIMDDIWDNNSSGGLDVPDKLGLTPSPQQPLTVKDELPTVEAGHSVCLEQADHTGLITTVSGQGPSFEMARKPCGRLASLGQWGSAGKPFFNCLSVWFADERDLPPAGHMMKPSECIAGAQLNAKLTTFMRRAGWTGPTGMRTKMRHVVFVDLAESSVEEVTRRIRAAQRVFSGGSEICLVDLHFLYARAGGTKSCLERHTYRLLRPTG